MFSLAVHDTLFTLQKLKRRVDSDLDFAFSYSTTETVLYNIQIDFRARVRGWGLDGRMMTGSNDSPSLAYMIQMDNG
jgi:hypothetical protein